MDEIHVVLVSLLLSVVVLGTIARLIRVPYPIVLVVGGLVLGLALGPDDTVTLDPDLVLVIFLPPLLYSAAFFANLHDIRRGIRVVSVLAIGLVLVTMCTVAVVAHTVVDGMSWPVAFVLGAIVSPTDALAPTQILRRLGVPRQLVSIVEGESLLNDGTALVAYHTALKAVVVGFVFLDAAGEFVVNAAGGIAIGLVAGKVLVEIRRRINDTPTEVTISLLSGYAGYLPAEELGVSGVLAAVTTGIVLGWKAPEISTASMRLQSYAVWETLMFLLNALLFVLIGLQLPMILEGLDEQPLTLLGWGAAVSATVILTRLVFSELFTHFIRAVDRRPIQQERRASWRMRVVGSWCGMRGAVSLAAALALAEDFPQRDIVLFLTFAVIFATLVLQGLTLPALIKLLGVEADGADEREELMGRRAAADAALARLDELGEAEWTRDDTTMRMRQMYEYRARRFAIRAGELDDYGDDLDAVETRSHRYQTMVRLVLTAQRQELVRLRNSGEISNEVMHRLERELDLEDERLEI